MKRLSPLPKPHKTGTHAGILIVKQLLRPSVKELIDLMNRTDRCYVGVTVDDNVGWLFIDDQPVIKVAALALPDILTVLADDVKEYHDIAEYRLLPERYKQILTYYI